MTSDFLFSIFIVQIEEFVRAAIYCSFLYGHVIKITACVVSGAVL